MSRGRGEYHLCVARWQREVDQGQSRRQRDVPRPSVRLSLLPCRNRSFPDTASNWRAHARARWPVRHAMSMSIPHMARNCPRRKRKKTICWIWRRRCDRIRDSDVRSFFSVISTASPSRCRKSQGTFMSMDMCLNPIDNSLSNRIRELNSLFEPLRAFASPP